MRGQWFIDGSWLPLEEEESDLIEQEHLNHFRGHQMQDTFESDLVVKTVDSKDGELKNGCGRNVRTVLRVKTCLISSAGPQLRIKCAKMSESLHKLKSE